MLRSDQVFGGDVQGFGDGVDGGEAGVDVALLDTIEGGEADAGVISEFFLGKAKAFACTPEFISEGLDFFLITVFYAGCGSHITKLMDWYSNSYKDPFIFINKTLYLQT